ncbi:unnamed protein product [Rotaria sp. Silwood1]|nr:unnamed protein product [Rotaria sp. Silwood1]CAF5063154.1 unnamed protein product [Rotaria sp. Silwood1]
MSGASYCPLSPNQPSARLLSLIEQVKTKCVLSHNRTNTLIPSSDVDISRILPSLNPTNFSDNDVLININSIAYVVSTSGSTGIPKLIPISHKNFAACINALSQSSIMMQNETVLQITPTTFDIHIQEILGTLWLGGCICLLRPNGNLDMNYLTSVVQRNQITFAITVPTLLATIAQHVHNYHDKHHTLISLQRLCSIGEPLRPRTASLLYDYLNPSAVIYHLYGPTECIFATTFHQITKADLQLDSLPIGRPLLGYKCYILDSYLQPVLADHQIGELFIGGEAVFGGYLHRLD